MYKNISLSEAQEISSNFWDWNYSAKGRPAEYPDEEVVRYSKLFDIKKKNKILDLGCGSGRHFIPFKRSNFKLYGIDKSISSEKYIKKKIKKKIIFKNFDFFLDSKLPYKKKFFDGIIAFQIFDHIHEDAAYFVLNECSRIVKKDGYIFLTLLSKQTNCADLRGKKIDGQKKSEIVNYGNSSGEMHTFHNLDKFQNKLKLTFRIISKKNITIENITHNQKKNKIKQLYIVAKKK